MNSSRFRGVTWVTGKKRGGWQAEIRIDGARHGLGVFKEEESAARAYDDFLRATLTGGATRGAGSPHFRTGSAKLRWKEFNFPRDGERAVGASDSSQFRGVSYTRGGRWEAKIRVGNYVKYLGAHPDEEAAAWAFDAAAVELRGASAKTNFGPGRQPNDAHQHDQPRAPAHGAPAPPPTPAPAAAATRLPGPGDRVDCTFEIEGTGTSRWFPGQLVRYSQAAGPRGSKRRRSADDGDAGDEDGEGCRGGAHRKLPCGSRQATAGQQAAEAPADGGWALVAFDDGIQLQLQLQPGGEGTLWRLNASRAHGTEQLRTSTFASPSAERRMRAKQWQTDTTDEAQLDSQRLFPIYTASSSIDCSANGFGCFATGALTKDQFIAEYAGEIICDDQRQEDGCRRSSEYIFDLGDGLAVDATHGGNPTRRINHCSLTPNTRVVVANHRGVRKVCLYAAEDIAAHAELSVDYGANFWSREARKPMAPGEFPLS